MPIERIIEKKYSLNYNEYIERVETPKVADEVIVMRPLGELCEFIGGQKRKVEDALTSGPYKFITCSVQGYSYLNSYDFEDDALIINAINGSGKCMIYNATNYSTTTNNIHFKSKSSNIIINKFIYYYLLININLLENGFMGTNQKKISKDFVSNLQIPVPPLERQRKIVADMERLCETGPAPARAMIDQLKADGKWLLERRDDDDKSFREATLGEICNIDYGTRIVKEKNTEGIYPVYGSGRATFTTNSYNREGFNILIGRFALSEECVRLVNEQLYLNDSGLTIKPKTDTLLHKYIGYYLYHNQSCVYNLAKGSAQKNLQIEEFKQLLIPIPPLARQREIVAKLDQYAVLIHGLEQVIESNKAIAADIIAKVAASATAATAADDVTDEPEIV